MKPERLFDCIDYQLQQFPQETMLAAKEGGTWRHYSTTEVKQIVDNLSAGMLALGLGAADGTPEGVDKIGIISNNRPEWLCVDMACQQIGVSLVPVYPTTNPLELEFIFNDAAVKYIFVSSADLLEKIQSIQPKIPSLQQVFTFEKIEGAAHWNSIGEKATDALQQQLQTIKASIQPQHLATIIYTSGTTGTPKGVMLSHQNILSNVMNSKVSFPFEDAPQNKVLSFLPLNHIFERMCSYIFMYSGISIWYAESLETIGENMKEVRPDGFTTVPRLLEKVYEKIMSTGAKLTGVKKKLFDWAVELGFQYDNLKPGSWWYRTQLALANKLIFSKWRQALGENVSFIVTGGAACQERLLRIFNGAGVPVYEGYGPTENSPVISVNRKEKGGTKFGTVGPPIDGQEVKLAEDGEILVKGPSVMLGYYKRPDLTDEVVKDGWLYTGDIGIWVDDKYLKITDRKKELFKTSGGKYVAPQPIENKLKESPYIEQAIVIGAEKKFVGALIVPSFPNLRDWMQKNGLKFTTNEEAVRLPQVHQFYRDLVDSFNTYFNHVEQVKRFELLPAEWSIDTGEMTPKMSLKRKVIMEKYKGAVERIYE